MEYVDGDNITGLTVKHGKLKEDVVKSFTRQILKGLEHIHAKSIMHKDVNGSNVLVDRLGTCKLADFSIARYAKTWAGEYLTGDNAKKSGIYWRAPELVNYGGMGFDHKVDVWSAGCVVLEMWTGERPWGDLEEDEVLRAVRLYELGDSRSSLY